MGCVCRAVVWADSLGSTVTSASVTTLFLNRRSRSSSDEHLGLRSRKALGSGLPTPPHKFYVGGGQRSMLGRWILKVRRGRWDTGP